MNEKICCVTGHRYVHAHDVTYVKSKLQDEIELAISEHFTTFITGMADGVDLLFAELVIEKKSIYPQLRLEAAIPYCNRLYSKNIQLQKCLAGCNSIHIQQQKYDMNCYMNRNRYMVDQSSRVIAVYDGRKSGGTLFTMKYAQTLGREVRKICLENTVV